MTERLPNLCSSCLRLKGGNRCEAFSRGIPDDIFVWGDSHVEPTKEQNNDLVWVFKPGTEEQFEQWKKFQEQRIR